MTLHFAPYPAETRTRSRQFDHPEQAPKSADGLYRTRLKRWFDVAVTLCSLPLVLPLVGLMALLISLDGHNPFYSQLRLGRDGRPFRIWKLRTMVRDADAQLAAYLAENAAARLEWEMTQKLKTDPRITLVGRILRKCSADELPQLWNVLNGSMSLVGPRPMMVSQKPGYEGEGYFRLRPGMTGPWQVSDRNACAFAERARFDDLYDQTLSFRTDLAILVRTVAVVLRGTGY